MITLQRHVSLSLVFKPHVIVHLQIKLASIKDRMSLKSTKQHTCENVNSANVIMWSEKTGMCKLVYVCKFDAYRPALQT